MARYIGGVSLLCATLAALADMCGTILLWFDASFRQAEILKLPILIGWMNGSAALGAIVACIVLAWALAPTRKRRITPILQLALSAASVAFASLMLRNAIVRYEDMQCCWHDVGRVLVPQRFVVVEFAFALISAMAAFGSSFARKLPPFIALACGGLLGSYSFARGRWPKALTELAILIATLALFPVGLGVLTGTIGLIILFFNIRDSLKAPLN